MKNRSQFEREVKAVRANGAAIRVLRWHTPTEQPLRILPAGQTEEREYTPVDDEYPFLLVMEQGERSLHDACQKERFAGYESTQIITTFRQIVRCTQMLHATEIIHADLKQRNILRVIRDAYPDWILCDMDASSDIGAAIGRKTSSAYAPPELAARKYSGDSRSLAAEPSFDVWSLGVILFEICCGRSLFAQDTSNDELIEIADKTRLSVWDTITDDELSPVLQNAGDATPQTISDARNLIRWCLKGRPDERPTVAQILSHRLLCPDVVAPIPQPMRFHGFLSHAQADASGTVGTLYFSYKLLGLHNWIDMRQQKLTLEGMKQGVQDSRIFLFILSERILASWFCQQECLCALDEDKKIQLIVEEEPRFHPFDRVNWRAKAAAAKVPERICAMVEANLSQAVAYRRRDFEQAAMMRELCKRNGVVLPSIPCVLWPVGKPPLRVAVICKPSSAAPMLADLHVAMAHVSERVTLEVIEDDQPDLTGADCVLLLLTEGVLTQPSLGVLQETIRLDAAAQQDRIVAIFSADAGWEFGCDAQRQAPADVQSCLNDHEAICFRKKDDEGPGRHEFGAMISQLLTKLGAGPAALPVAGDADPAPPRTMREQLAVKDAALAAKDARLMELEARLASFEGIPPV